MRVNFNQLRFNKDVPPEASYQPRDAIYLPTIHRHIYGDEDIPIINLNDK